MPNRAGYYHLQRNSNSTHSESSATSCKEAKQLMIVRALCS